MPPEANAADKPVKGRARKQHVGVAKERTWWLLDATSRPLGRLAGEAAALLIGKQKPTYVPYIDGGDAVVIINAADVVLTGNKVEQKTYFHHTGYPTGLRAATAKERIMAGKQTDMIREAVKGMLPKNQLGPLMLKRLHVYSAAEHPHNQVELMQRNSD